MRLTPPSKNSEVRRLWPTPSCLLAVSHGVVIVPPVPLVGPLTVAQALSDGDRRRLAVDAVSDGRGAKGAVGAAVPAVDVDRADRATVGEGGDDQQVAVRVVAAERRRCRWATSRSTFSSCRNQKPTLPSPVLALRSSRSRGSCRRSRRCTPRVGVHDVDLAVDVGVVVALPPRGDRERVLAPVAKVVSSDVLNEPFAFVLKSLWKTEASNPEGSAFSFPAASKKLSQSSV